MSSISEEVKSPTSLDVGVELFAAEHRQVQQKPFVG